MMLRSDKIRQNRSPTKPAVFTTASSIHCLHFWSVNINIPCIAAVCSSFKMGQSQSTGSNTDDAGQEAKHRADYYELLGVERDATDDELVVSHTHIHTGN